MKVEREKALEHKKRMSRMMEDKENFLSKITAARSFIYEVGDIPPATDSARDRLIAVTVPFCVTRKN